MHVLIILISTGVMVCIFTLWRRGGIFTVTQMKKMVKKAPKKTNNNNPKTGK